MPGSPIRTPWDHSLVDSSPRPIAASHVLHRLLVPRHPPFALDNLTTKMLASTVQFSTNDQPTTHSPTPANPPTDPVCETRPCLADSQDPHQASDQSLKQQPHGLFLQDPTGCYPPLPSRITGNRSHPPRRTGCTRRPRPLPGKNLPVSPPSEHPTTTLGQRGLHTSLRWMVLLRKEVIQPHLPVRLPCYDFVPIASPTFDGSLHKGWATGFGCCRLS